jgi:outer membrane receptor protein involved in Fe transport
MIRIDVIQDGAARNRRRSALLSGSAALVAMALATHAHGQAAAPAAGPTADQNSAVEEIVVTGSRIRVSGFTAPTPTTMLGAEDIAKNAQPNLFNTIAQLPSLMGSTGRATGVNSTSSGTQGLSSFSLRGLGTIRTLTLLDGQRVVGANVTGVPDISQFPQLLVQRVDVVTGGASASYGSDAVGGVVNFITDKKFQGFKANLEAGQTTYEDDKNYTAQIALGRAFAGDRLHVVASGEYSHEGGVPAFGFGEGPGPNGRTQFVSPAFQVKTIANTPAGAPQYTYIEHAQNFQYAKYGLITSGPLQGIAFGANGTPYNFVYGSNGVPTGTGAVTGCVTPFCVGGDLSGVVGNGTTLASKLTRKVAYGRIGYDLDDDNEIYATVNLAQVRSSNTPNPGAAKNANLTIQCANPFVPASIQAACAANNITSFQYGTANAEFPEFINVHPNRKQYRFVLGADGAFEAFGKKWTYDAYGEHGTNVTDIRVRDMSLTPRYNAAINAVAGPNGTVSCANAAAIGCVPLNIIGDVTANPAAINYVLPEVGPFQHTRQTQDIVSLSVSGQPFSLWAGPVSLATGGEYRREHYTVRADPYGNGVTADSPNSADYPADPVLNPAGNNWYAGNYHNGQGSYHVYEGFLELNVPVLDSEKLGKANLNLAGRQTKYSTSGNVSTWKVGATWDTPFEGLRLRAVTSRDVRAPNLSELYAAPIVVNTTVNNPSNGQTVTILQETVGNTGLKPEIARNTEVGVVLSRPRWLPGFSASVDYYKIKVDGVISTISAQQEVDLCFAGNQTLCSAILLTSPLPNTNFVRVQAFNLASITTEGVDIEASYRFSLDSLGLPGTFTVRALATHVMDFTTNSGLPGTIPTQGAGVNLGNTPDWKVLGIQSWDGEKASLTLTERWISDGVYSNEYIECQTNCPVSTVIHPTIDNNQMKGAFYLDLGGSYRIRDKVTAYFKVDNLLNKDAEPAPQTNVGYGANPALYDVLGRMYRIGVRYGF